MKVRFNNTFLADLIIQGYKYMILARNEEIITIAPSLTPFSREELSLLNMTLLNLSDPSQMTVIQNLDLLDDFIFLIDSRYFGDNDEYSYQAEQYVLLEK